MTGALVAGVVAGYGVALPVGPIATYLVMLGARDGLRTAAFAGLGVATGDGVFAAVAAFGGGRLHHVLRPVAGALTYISVAALLVLAVRTFSTAIRRYRDGTPDAVTTDGRPGPLRSYLAMVALTALNPSTIAYFCTLVLADRSGILGTGAPAATLFAVGALSASASWQLLLAGSGASLGRVLAGRRGRLLTSAASSAIMTALAALLLAS